MTKHVFSVYSRIHIPDGVFPGSNEKQIFERTPGFGRLGAYRSSFWPATRAGLSGDRPFQRLHSEPDHRLCRGATDRRGGRGHALQQLSDFAYCRRVGSEPKDLLRRTHVTRSFTAFQTEAAITTRLPEFLQRRSCGVVLILGLLQTYYDEQIHVHESEHSLHRILQTLHRVKAQNRHVLIAEVDVENPPEGKEHLFGMIRAATEVTLSMQPVDAGYELIEQRSIKWDETTNPSPWSLTGTE